LKYGVSKTFQKFLNTARNKWILENTGQRQLLHSTKKHKITYYGHTIRKSNYLEKVIKQGYVDGNRSRGQNKGRWSEDIIDWTGLLIDTAVKVTEYTHRYQHGWQCAEHGDIYVCIL